MEDAAWQSLRSSLGIAHRDSLESTEEDVLVNYERWRRSAEGEHHGLRYRLRAAFSSRHSVWVRLTEAIRAGIPTALRGDVWYLCSGAVRKRRLSVRSYADLVQAGKASRDTVAAKAVAADLERTGCDTSYIPSLENVLLAYTVWNPTVGYCQSMNFVAATLLLYCSEERTFWMLCSLIEDLLPTDYYTDRLSGLRADIQVFDRLVQQYLPQLHMHFARHAIDISPILTNWFLCLFINTLPLEHSHRVLDCVLHEGNKVLFRTGLAILSLQQSSLLSTTSVVEAYTFLRQPVGNELAASNMLLESVDITAECLISCIYGAWLRGLRSEQVRQLRKERVMWIQAEDEEVDARRNALRARRGEELRSAAKGVAEPQPAEWQVPQQSPQEAKRWMSFVLDVPIEDADELAEPPAHAPHDSRSEAPAKQQLVEPPANASRDSLGAVPAEAQLAEPPVHAPQPVEKQLVEPSEMPSEAQLAEPPVHAPSNPCGEKPDEEQLVEPPAYSSHDSCGKMPLAQEFVEPPGQALHTSHLTTLRPVALTTPTSLNPRSAQAVLLTPAMAPRPQACAGQPVTFWPQAVQQVLPSPPTIRRDAGRCATVSAYAVSPAVPVMRPSTFVSRGQMLQGAQPCATTYMYPYWGYVVPPRIIVRSRVQTL